MSKLATIGRVQQIVLGLHDAVDAAERQVVQDKAKAIEELTLIKSRADIAIALLKEHSEN